MRGVLYVPDLGISLYSINSATDAGMQVLFTKENVILSRDGVILVTGKKTGSLYHLNIIADPPVDPLQPLALRSTKVEPLSLWHQRFAHLNYKSVLRTASLGCTTGLFFFNDKDQVSTCKGCLLGKMHRHPFKVGREATTSVGELIHTDVCGPMQVSTPNGARYFVIFKDDYSNWCATKIIKNKSDVAALLKEFVALVKTQKGYAVKTIRSDNGGEYFGKELVDWLAKSGIRHESSAPHTPQQNGVAERYGYSV